MASPSDNDGPMRQAHLRGLRQLFRSFSCELSASFIAARQRCQTPVNLVKHCLTATRVEERTVDLGEDRVSVTLELHIQEWV